MSEAITKLLHGFKDQKVLVIGEAMLDSYSRGSTGRLCQEAPVPVVDVFERSDAPGGAANSAANACSLGARASLVSVVGDDVEGDLLRQSLDERGVSTRYLLTCPGRRTLAKHRVLSGDQMIVRFDQGSTSALEGKTQQWLIAAVQRLYPQSDAVIVSDYGYGVVTPPVIECLAKLQARTPRTLVVDSKHLPDFRRAGVTAVKPNYREAMELSGASQAAVDRPEAVAAAAARILKRSGARIAAVTLDRDGAIVLERGKPVFRTHARPAPDFHAAGAGDTFLTAFALALAAGAMTSAAAELASAAAAVVVGKGHTAACSTEELLAQLSGRSDTASDFERAAARAAGYRSQRRRIVLTNGCFDILHRGHIAYLQQARKLGDVLVVGVNTDESIRRLKGSGRPINSLRDRLDVLAALSSVDHLVAFDEDTPHRLIEAVRPDVFVKGGDYTRAMLPEAGLVESLGGKVVILPYLADRSTTGLIERIRQAPEENHGKQSRYAPASHDGDPAVGRGGPCAVR